MSAPITFTGLSTDQNFNEIIDALVSARRTSRIGPLEDWKQIWQTKLETISNIDSVLSAFYSTVRSMDRISEFLVRTASSSNTGILTASANSEALVGSHSIVVNQLAQAETEVHQGIQNSIQYHSGVDDQTLSINDSGTDKTFVYEYDGTVRSITVANGDTLQDLMNSINNDADNPGVTAKIVTYGGKDHLVLVESTPSGSASVVIDPNGDMTLDGTDSTVDFTTSTFVETINASGSDKIFEFQYGSNTPVQVTISTGATLEDLCNLINNANSGVTASILSDGGSGSAARHLVVSGKDTGADYSITLNPTGATTLDGNNDTEDFSDGTFTETVSAQNAQIRVDGYPSSGWIERSTNHITDVITGVTLDLLDADSTETVTVTVGTDKEAIIQKVEEFKDAFNNVRSAIKEATFFNSDTGESGSLLGNYALQIIKTRLDSLLSSSAPGFRDPDDPYINLQQLGFHTDVEEGSQTEGLLLLDTSQLSAALDSNPDAVAKVFSVYFEGITNDDQITFQSSLDTATCGIYDLEIDTDNERGRFRLQGSDWGDWIDLEGSSGDYYLTGISGPERGIALHITYLSGTGTHSAELRLKNGIVTEMSRQLEKLLSSSGPLEVLTEHYNDIIENIDERIDEEEERLQAYEERLRMQYARLDAYIGRMTQLSNYLAAYSQQLANS